MNGADKYVVYSREVAEPWVQGSVDPRDLSRPRKMYSDHFDANVEQCSHLMQSMNEEDQNSYLAASKALSYLLKMENHGSCGVERGSVYGAAVAMPQIARSTGYSATFSAFAVRSYFFLIINIFVQLFLLSVICEEAHIMSAFSGKMHMCDYGKQKQSCPDAPNCKGPGGTAISFPRLYHFQSWILRAFFRDTMMSLFPDKEEEISEHVDVGEYAMENYYCRLVCCFVFFMGVMEDFKRTYSLAHLLHHIPTASQKWIRYETPGWAEKDHIKSVHQWRELDLVRYGVAGMPRCWKIFTFIFVIIPKFVIWFVMALSGNHFLMETAGTVNLIMNSVALTFVLDIDEMIFRNFTTVPTRHIMANMEDYDLFVTDHEETETEAEAIHRFYSEEFGPSSIGKFKMITPVRLFHVIFAMGVFNVHYYLFNCDRGDDGSWTSKPIFLPTHVSYNPAAWILRLKFFGWSEASESTWSMPLN